MIISIIFYKSFNIISRDRTETIYRKNIDVDIFRDRYRYYRSITQVRSLIISCPESTIMPIVVRPMQTDI